MNMAFKPLTRALLLQLSLAGVVAAQQSAPPASPAPAVPAARSNAQIDAGEPRANTSPTSAAPAPTATPAPTPAPAAAPRTAPRTAPAKGAGAADRLNLGTATVTGDREQPKVMYIVPWKSSNIGDLSGKPMNSLLDEALAPVDRDEFKREVAYYDAVRTNAPQNGASSPAAKQGEK